jgi:hypothetical protein
MSLNSQTKSLFKMTGPLISNDHKFNAEAVVASVTLSSLPTNNSTTNYTTVQAMFPSTVELSTNTTYCLSFSINGMKVGYNDMGDAFLFCSGNTTTCLASNSSWTYFGGVLTMEVSSPLPSSASSLQWGSSFMALAWACLTGPST